MHSDTAPWIRDSEHGTGKVLVVRSQWMNSFGDLLRSERITSLRLSYSAGFRGDSIEFVADLPFLTSLEVYSFEVSDVSTIRQLHNLEVLGLEAKFARGLEGWNPPLRVALLRWCKDLSFVFDLETIRYLNVVNYPYKNLLPLNRLGSLQRLSLTSRKLEALAGLDGLFSLTHLDLFNCPNLLSVEEARSRASIKHLQIEACRHVSRELLVETHA